TGLILYLPTLSADVGRRPLIKDVHFWGGIGWVSALALVAVLGDRRGLLRTTRELDLFAPEDVNWLRRRRPNEQDRFNARQNAHARPPGGFPRPLPRLGSAAVVRGARHAVPVRQPRDPPRRASVRLARAARRPPLPRRDPPGDPPRAAGDDARHGEGGLGPDPSRTLAPLGAGNGRECGGRGGPARHCAGGRR